jgi:peptidoglycan/LPS O-acetylase OafA/YrhL
MGILRFTLAILVLLSHNGVSFLGLNPGVMAVVIFYVISGYVMAALIENHYKGLDRTKLFYGDRLLRIYPQYVLYAALSWIWLVTVGHPTHFLILTPSVMDVLNNVLIVPLNYFMYNGSDRFTLVPPAWSLGAEVMFYVLAPFLWHRWRWAVVLGTFSLGVQVMAWHGVLHTDWWGYRLLPGVLWVFVIGMGIFRYQKTHKLRIQMAVWALLALLMLVAVYLHWGGYLSRPYHREVLLGLALGVPLVHKLSQYEFKNSGARRIDTQLGNLSYGIFLNHFLLMWGLGLNLPYTFGQWGQLLLGSILLSALTQAWVEQPILRLRKQWRQNGNTIKIKE